MPSQQEVQWSQLKVGVLVIVALAALTALIFLMTGSTGGLFQGKIVLRSYFENAAGLKEGAPVNLGAEAAADEDSGHASIEAMTICRVFSASRRSRMPRRAF